MGRIAKQIKSKMGIHSKLALDLEDTIGDLERVEDQLERLEVYSIQKVIKSLNKAHSDLKRNFRIDRLVAACISGKCVLEFNQADRDVPIAGPNGAAAGTFKRPLVLTVKTLKGEVIEVLDGIAPAITPAKSGAGFSDPTISPASPVFVKGRASLDLIYTTDEGSSEIYAADDTVSLSADLSVCGIDLDQVIYTDTLIA